MNTVKARKAAGAADTEGAIEHLEKAVALAPQFSEALNNLGTIYFQKRNSPERSFIFARRWSRNRRPISRWSTWEEPCWLRKRPREALEFNRHVQNERPRDALANAQLGLNYFLLGDNDRALTYLELAKELDPGHFSNPQVSLAESTCGAPNWRQPAGNWKSSWNTNPDGPQAESARRTIQKIERTSGNTSEKKSSL